MPHLLFLAAVGAGAYAGYRVLKSTIAGLATQMEEAKVEVRERAKAKDARDLGVLEYDPQSGVYRPRR
jgi:hypothetical protein